MSWFKATGTSLMAIGIVCFKIPERTTIRTCPGAMRFDELPSRPAGVIRSSASTMTSTFMSLGDTQGMSPFQNAGTSRLGVPPPENRANCLRRDSVQCAGTFPSHFTPLSLYSAYPGKLMPSPSTSRILAIPQETPFASDRFPDAHQAAHESVCASYAPGSSSRADIPASSMCYRCAE